MDKNFKKNILKGSLATSIGTLSGMLFQFLTVMLVVRYVTKNEMGMYALIMVVVNMFSLLAGLGLELTMVKSIASSKIEENKDILIPILVLRAVGAFVFSIIFLLAGKFILHFFDDQLSLYLLYVPIIFVLANFRDLFYNLLQGLNRFRQYSVVNVVSSFFRVLVVLLFIYFDKINIETLLIIEILATLQPLVHQIFIIPFKKYFEVKPTISSFDKIIKFSTPLYLNNLFVFINGRINIFMIGAYLSPANVASFSVASNIPMALKKIFSSFIIVYFPNLAKLFSEGDKKTAESFINKSLSIFSMVVTILVLFSFIFKNEIIILLYSQKYLDSALLAALLIFNFHIRGMADLMGYSFTPAGHPSVPAKVNFIASIISAAASLVAIPIFGVIGAAYALIFMNLVSFTLFYLHLIKYKIKLQLLELFKPILVLAAVLIVYFLIDSEYLILKIAFIILFFILQGIFVNEFREIIKVIITQLLKLKNNYITNLKKH